MLTECEAGEGEFKDSSPSSQAISIREVQGNRKTYKTGKRLKQKHIRYNDELANKVKWGGLEERQVNKTWEKLIRAGQTIKTGGKRTKAGSVKQNETHKLINHKIKQEIN